MLHEDDELVPLTETSQEHSDSDHSSSSSTRAVAAEARGGIWSNKVYRDTSGPVMVLLFNRMAAGGIYSVSV